METIQKRDFSVNYSILTDNLWMVSSELNDEQHHIMTSLEIEIPTLKITNAQIEFRRYPIKFCAEICSKAQELVGCSIIHELSSKLDDMFSGPAGCPNVRHLFGIAGPGFIYIYYPHLIKEGQITQADWWKIVGTQLSKDCLAHTRMTEHYQESLV